MKGLLQVIAGPGLASFSPPGADLGANAMRRTILATLAALGLAAAGLTGAAEAQHIDPQTGKTADDTWIFVRFADGAMGWNLHAGKWNTAGDTIEGQRLVWYAKPIMVDGAAITWAQDYWKIVCPANTMEIKSGEELSAGLLTLFKTKSSAPYVIEEKTTDHYLKLVYCDNRMLADTQEAKGIIGVMAAMQKPQAPPQ